MFHIPRPHEYRAVLAGVNQSTWRLLARSQPSQARATTLARLGAGVLAGALAAAAPAQPTAEAVYRCGPDGGSYSARPCTDGRAVPVEDSRTDQQVSQAREAARRERALADRMTAERIAMESRAPAGPINLAPHGGDAKPAPSHRPKKSKQRQSRLGAPPSKSIGPAAPSPRHAAPRAGTPTPRHAKRNAAKPKSGSKHPHA